MSFNLKEFQKRAIEELQDNFFNLWKNGLYGAELVFESATGSGKTVMIAEFLRKITDSSIFDEDIAFVWISFSADSYEQSKNKLDNYYDNNSGLNLMDLDSINNNQKLQRNDLFFVNWQKLNSKAKENRKLRLDTESVISFDTFIKNTHNENRKIILLVDESHIVKDTTLSTEIIKIINPKIKIFISATPKNIPNAKEIKEHQKGYVSTNQEDIIASGLIKEKIEINIKEEIENIIDDDKKDLDEKLIDLAIKKRKHLQQLYSKESVDINPLILIQLPNDEKNKKNINGQDKLSFVKEYLSKNKIEDKSIAEWLNKKDRNPNLILQNNSPIDFLIFKQAIATGWDCPRAQVLVMFREIKSPSFKTQVLGRILRMPEAKHYDKNTQLNKSYVYTSYELNDVRQGTGPNKIAYLKSKLRKNIDNIELDSVFLKRTKYNDLGYTFQDTFIPLVNNFFDIHSEDSPEEIEEKLLIKGLDLKENNVTNELIINAEINTYDNAFEELKNTRNKLKHKASNNDIEKLYNLLIYKEIISHQEEDKKFAPERSWGKLKTAINVWMKKHLGISNLELYPIVCNDLLKTKSTLRPLIEKSLSIYKPIRNKELEKKLIQSEEHLKFTLQDFYSYTDDYQQMKKISKSAICPFYFNDKKTSGLEKDFIRYLENQNIDWWFKNGDYGRNNFSIKYKDKNSVLKLFYPDFIIKQNNNIWILDTKGGITAESENVFNKAKALQNFIKKNSSSKIKLLGGIVINSKKGWKFNNNRNYKYNKNDLSEWKDLYFN